MMPPRGQDSQPWISRVRLLSSRMARSRYFSRISSSVAGMDDPRFDGPAGGPREGAPRSPPPLAAPAAAPRAPAPPPRRLRGRLGLEELQRLHVEQRARLR